MTPQVSLPRIAAIDVGTNSIRLIVVEVLADGSYRVLDEEREMTRLGQGLDRSGRLAPEALEKSLEAVGKMKAIADGFGVTELRAAATSAVRVSANESPTRLSRHRSMMLSSSILRPDFSARSMSSRISSAAF